MDSSMGVGAGPLKGPAPRRGPAVTVPGRPAAGELPLVGEPQAPVVRAPVPAGKGSKGLASLQDLQRGLVEFGMAAGALDRWPRSRRPSEPMATSMTGLPRGRPRRAAAGYSACRCARPCGARRPGRAPASTRACPGSATGRSRGRRAGRSSVAVAAAAARRGARWPPAPVAVAAVTGGSRSSGCRRRWRELVSAVATAGAVRRAAAASVASVPAAPAAAMRRGRLRDVERRVARARLRALRQVGGRVVASRSRAGLR